MEDCFNECLKCGVYFKHYKIFSKNVDGLKEVKLICFCSRCRNELKTYKEINKQLLDVEYQLFLWGLENPPYPPTASGIALLGEENNI